MCVCVARSQSKIGVGASDNIKQVFSLWKQTHVLLSMCYGFQFGIDSWNLSVMEWCHLCFL